GQAVPYLFSERDSLERGGGLGNYLIVSCLWRLGIWPPWGPALSSGRAVRFRAEPEPEATQLTVGFEPDTVAAEGVGKLDGSGQQLQGPVVVVLRGLRPPARIEGIVANGNAQGAHVGAQLVFAARSGQQAIMSQGAQPGDQLDAGFAIGFARHFPHDEMRLAWFKAASINARQAEARSP